MRDFAISRFRDLETKGTENPHISLGRPSCLSSIRELAQSRIRAIHPPPPTRFRRSLRLHRHRASHRRVAATALDRAEERKRPGCRSGELDGLGRTDTQALARHERAHREAVAGPGPTVRGREQQPNLVASFHGERVPHG